MPTHLLHICGLKKSFISPDATQHLIMDVLDFSIDAQMHVALAGESGSGKTTFLSKAARRNPFGQ